MSLKTWKAEFCPVEASEATGSALEAAEHSLRKWRGLRKSEVARHGVSISKGTMSDGFADLGVNGDTCALCQFDNDVDDNCAACPLFLVRDQVGCWERLAGEHADPYSVFCEDGDPEPMIAWLEKTVEYCKQSVPAGAVTQQGETASEMEAGRR